MPVMEATELTPLEWLAVGIVAREAGKHRDDVEVGNGQEVDLMLRVQGRLDVRPGGMSQRHQKPSPEKLLACILAALSSDASSEALSDLPAYLRRLAAENGGILPAPEEGYVAMATGLVKALSPSTEIPRRGSTKGNFRVGRIDTARLPQAAASEIKRNTRSIRLED